jgi:hypothetical protein
MPLNLPTSRSTNDFVAFLRYAAQTGTWHTRDGQLHDITGIWDLAQVQTAWMAFAPATPPDIVWDVDGKAAPRPSKDHRRGFSARLAIGDAAYELTSTQTGLIGALVKIHNEYEAAPEADRGLLPLVQCADLLSVENTFGRFYDPVLEIIDWVERPAALPRSKPQSAGLPAVRVGRALDDEIPF